MSCSVCVCTHHFAYHPDDACEIGVCGCTQFRVLDQTAWAKEKTVRAVAEVTG